MKSSRDGQLKPLIINAVVSSARSGIRRKIPSQILRFTNKEKELPHAIQLCDWVCIPNRYTYFDLITLEVMAMAKPVLTTKTGGNRYLSKLSEGVVAVSSEDVVEEMTQAIKSTPFDKLSELGAFNLRAYEENFSMKQFVGRHEALTLI